MTDEAMPEWPFEDPAVVAFLDALQRAHREYEQALVERAERAEAALSAPAGLDDRLDRIKAALSMVSREYDSLLALVDIERIAYGPLTARSGQEETVCADLSAWPTIDSIQPLLARAIHRVQEHQGSYGMPGAGCPGNFGYDCGAFASDIVAEIHRQLEWDERRP